MGKEVVNMTCDEESTCIVTDEPDVQIPTTNQEVTIEGNGLNQEDQNIEIGNEMKAQVEAKPVQSDNSSKRLDEEDSSSIASSNAASAKTSKSKITFASGPVFKCSERAEKRREFYQKLEEKHQAMEEQKNQTEAKAKKEQDAMMRQFRKSLTFKAAPMPSFYKEGPPPKTELKKLPTTRAKSPKLGRRKSYSGISTNKDSAESDHTKSRIGTRHSLDSATKNAANVVAKDRVNKPVPTRAHKVVSSNDRVVNIAIHT